MKILLCGPVETEAIRQATGLTFEGAPHGTVQTPVVPLAAQLWRQHHEVHLITLDPTSETVQTFREGSFLITYCPLRASPKYRARVRALDMFEKEIRSLTDVMVNSSPDFVHAHWTYEYAEAAVRSRLPHLVTMHDLGWDYFAHFRDAYRAIRLLMKYRVMPRVRNLAVVSPFMKTKVWQYGYFGQTWVVPNGIAVPAFDEAAVEGRLQRPIKIVTIGNPARIKNVQASVAAFRKLRSRWPTAELHLFGPGLDHSYAQHEDGIFPHGGVLHRELMQFLEREATVLVHPARLETFGVTIVEAKARSIPVVAGARSGGVPYVCGHNAGCALVDVRCADAIADALIRLLSDQRSYCASARLGWEDAKARFGIESVSDTYARLYSSILERWT